MNRMKAQAREAIVSALVEGASIRSVERMTGAHRDSITRYLVHVGGVCDVLMDEFMRDLDLGVIEVDEIWAYVGKKQRWVTKDDDPSRVGDFWTWVAIDADTKLVPCYRVGKRDGTNAAAFMVDLASRLRNRVQLTTDGLNHYVEAVEAGFGGDVDWATLVKSYEAEPIGEGKYSPPRVTSTTATPMVGAPAEDRISTSYVERQNLTMRMAMRRFTRLTNAFSKKVENLEAAVALHFAHYNLIRPHGSLKKATPAMAAGLAYRPWSVRELVELAG